jgi:hypothetical protein
MKPAVDSVGSLTLSRLWQLSTVMFPAVIASGAEMERKLGQSTMTSDPTDSILLRVMVSMSALP